MSRRADADIVPAAERHGLSLLPYYPLECGLLTGRYRRGETVPEDSRFAGRPDIWPAERWLDDEAFDRLEALEAVAAEAGATVLDLAIGGLAALPVHRLCDRGREDARAGTCKCGRGAVYPGRGDDRRPRFSTKRPVEMLRSDTS